MKNTILFQEKVFAYMEQYHMIEAGDTVVAGVSGGADSVCLLFLLLAYQKKLPFSILVVHVNHGIRTEAAQDADFVRQLCERFELPFTLVQEDVEALAKETHRSVEEAGRDLRYASFCQLLPEKGGKIAVAHNANDRAETVLHHLFRGSGIRGLSGIRPVRDQIIRPLLGVTREEIEAYLREIGQDFCEDATNAQDHYVRNRIRHHILAYAQSKICAGSVRNINQTAMLLTQAQEYLEEEIAKAYQACLIEEKSDICVLDAKKLMEKHIYLQKGVILEAVSLVSGKRRDITGRHVEEIQELLVTGGSKSVQLPDAVSVKKEYERLTIARGIEISEIAAMPYNIDDFIIRETDAETLKIEEKKYTKWFDYDKIEKYPIFRMRQPGDYLTIRNHEGRMIHKSLKDYMINEKIPAGLRDKIPVLAENNHVLWLVGYRISEYYKVSDTTKRVLEVSLPEEETEDK